MIEDQEYVQEGVRTCRRVMDAVVESSCIIAARGRGFIIL